jgi:hypothetical protein
MALTGKPLDICFDLYVRNFFKRRVRFKLYSQKGLKKKYKTFENHFLGTRKKINFFNKMKIHYL